jgi:hypothetical protein
MNELSSFEDETIQQMYPYSAKAEQTAKGLRITVHCRGFSEEEVRDSAVRLYLKLGHDFLMHGVPLAKAEVVK